MKLKVFWQIVWHIHLFFVPLTFVLGTPAQKNSKISVFFVHLFVPLTFVLGTPVQKNSKIFGFSFTYSYLCNSFIRREQQ